MALINPKPRFGYDSETKQIYDYVTQKDVSLISIYEAPDGQWNLYQVRDLILSGQTIEAARISPARGHVPVLDNSVTKGLSAAQLQALKLSPLQLAALKFTQDQISSTGVTELELQKLAMTPMRADALKLTPEQRKALMV